MVTIANKKMEEKNELGHDQWVDDGTGMYRCEIFDRMDEGSIFEKMSYELRPRWHSIRRKCQGDYYSLGVGEI